MQVQRERKFGIVLSKERTGLWLFKLLGSEECRGFNRVALIPPGVRSTGAMELVLRAGFLGS